MALDAVIGLAGAETKVGQALLLAKQILQMKEMMMDLKNLTFKGKKAIGETAVDSAQNVSKSAKIGFPQNIITIAAAIGQGISIMNTVKKAVAGTGNTGRWRITTNTTANSFKKENKIQVQHLML